MADDNITEASIDALALPARVRHCLLNNGVSTVGEAIAIADSTLLRMPNFGRTSLTTMRDRIEAYLSSNGAVLQPVQQSMTDFLTVQEAAAFIRLSVHTLNAYRAKGNGPPYFKLGGRHVRYDRAQLEAWARSEPCNSTSEYRK